MLTIDRLRRVPLREVWSHEARDFTTWLANNLELLSETLGFPLSLIQREVRAGMFSADILADTGNERLAPQHAPFRLYPGDNRPVGQFRPRCVEVAAEDAGQEAINGKPPVALNDNYTYPAY